jgi:uncharacterized protein (TIGR02996 family)
MTDLEQTFLLEIEAEPGNRLRQLIFADWLEDRGDARCELIRQSSSWKESRIRFVLKDWGLPVGEIPSDKLMMAFVKQRVFHNGDVYSTRLIDLEVVPWRAVLLWHSEEECSHLDPYGVCVCWLSLDDWQVSVSRRDLMPPGWIGHKKRGAHVAE